jgi:5-methylcytosine-specific restriction enzyme subunit McrC
VAVADTEGPGELGFGSRKVGRIPVRNLWLLMLYASDLVRLSGPDVFGVEENFDELPDLVAELLCRTVEQRLKRNLSFGYRLRDEVLTRVRGRINVLQTFGSRLLERGQVACRFEELTIDTPRNRLVRSSLETLSRIVRRPDLRHRCWSLATDFALLGVAQGKPSRAQISAEQIGRHDAADRFLVALAQLAFDLTLPTEDAGMEPLFAPDREIAWVRRLYEKGVAGFYEVVLTQPRYAWTVHAGQPLKWPVEAQTAGLAAILPTMVTDIVLNHPSAGRRIVVDTKFNEILTRGLYRDETLRSGYLYQIYAYIRSQCGRGDKLADQAEGLLLHPAVGEIVDEAVVMQGHLVRFSTVDLAAPASSIRQQLLDLVTRTPLGVRH